MTQDAEPTDDSRGGNLTAPETPFSRFKHRFVPWYSEKFSLLITLDKPWNYVAQGGLWYFGAGFIWIPIWFLLTESDQQLSSTRSMNGTADATPLRLQLSEAISKVDWAKVATIAGKVLVMIGTAFVAVIAVIGAVAVAADSTCKHCGQAKRPGYPVCPNCGWSR